VINRIGTERKKKVLSLYCSGINANRIPPTPPDTTQARKICTNLPCHLLSSFVYVPSLFDALLLYTPTFRCFYGPAKSSSSAFRLATGWTTEGPCSSSGGVKNVRFSISPRPVLGPTQPPIQWLPGALSQGVKQPGQEADRSLPVSAEIKKTWSINTSTLPYVFIA
jgi:hypothetical protein